MGKLRKFDQLFEHAIAALTKARDDNVVREEKSDQNLPPANIKTPPVAEARLPNNVSAKAKKDDVVKKEIKHNKTIMKKKKRDETARSFQQKKTKAIIES